MVALLLLAGVWPQAISGSSINGAKVFQIRFFVITCFLGFVWYQLGFRQPRIIADTAVQQKGLLGLNNIKDNKLTYSPQHIPHSAYHDINGLRLHLCHWAAADKPKLLLLHGWMDCAASFQFVADALGGDWDIYAPDWRGCGLSAHQIGGYYDRALMLADLAAWVDIISPHAPIYMVGHSMGGMLAAHYAGAFPERVRGLALLEGFGIEDGDIHDAAARSRRFIEALQQPQQWHNLGTEAAVAAKLRQRNPLLDEAQAQFVAAALTRQTASGSLIYKADIKHKIPQPMPYRLSVAYALWQHIRAPLLWVEGGLLPHNRYLQHIAATLDERHAALGQPPKITIAESGHMLHWEAPQAVAAALATFGQAAGDTHSKK